MTDVPDSGPWKRIERIGDAVLILGDCFECLPMLPKVEAVITDPPYGIGFAAQPTNYQRAAGMQPCTWDNVTVEGLSEMLALGDIQVVWGGNFYALPISRGWLSWFKPDAPPSMGSVELAWTNRNQNHRQISHSISATNGERAGHPTQKPLAVMRWCISRVGRPLSILDPFMGSGTTGVACAQLGRSFIGVEIAPMYFNIAVERITNAYRQESLFDPYDAVTKSYEQVKLL